MAWVRLAAIKRYLRWRPRRAVGFAVLSAISTVLLLLAWWSAEGFARELWLSLGASMVIVAFSFLIFDPLFEDARKARVEEHLRFDHEEFSASVAASTTRIAILETWTGLLEDRHRPAFVAALRGALSRRVTARFLLLDPDSAAAQARAEELEHVNVRRLIMDNLRHLHELSRELPPAARGRLQVRVYDALPSIQLYQWDDKALFSFFPIGIRAYDAPQLEAYIESPWGEFVRGRFDELWQHESTRSLADYMALRLAVRLAEIELTRCVAPFVTYDTDRYVDGVVLVDHLTDHGIGQLRVRAGEGPDGELSELDYTLVRVAEQDPVRAAVLALFEAKYGLPPGNEHRLVLRLLDGAAG